MDHLMRGVVVVTSGPDREEAAIVEGSELSSRTNNFGEGMRDPRAPSDGKVLLACNCREAPTRTISQ
jgi:hypothetical protein